MEVFLSENYLCCLSALHALDTGHSGLHREGRNREKGFHWLADFFFFLSHGRHKNKAFFYLWKLRVWERSGFVLISKRAEWKSASEPGVEHRAGLTAVSCPTGGRSDHFLGSREAGERNQERLDACEKPFRPAVQLHLYSHPSTSVESPAGRRADQNPKQVWKSSAKGLRSPLPILSAKGTNSQCISH